MSDLDPNLLTSDMLNAAKAVVGERWSEGHMYGERAIRKLAEVLEEIQTKYASGKVTKEHAQALLRIGRNTAISILMAVKGLSQGAAEDAVNAALAAVKTQINEDLGWMLL